MSEELRRCPFCGGEAKHNSKEPERINCTNMSCYQSEEWREYGYHINEWQSRPLEDALIAERDALQKEITRLGSTLGDEILSNMKLKEKLEKAKEALKYFVKGIIVVNRTPDGEIEKYQHPKVQEALKLLAELEAE